MCANALSRHNGTDIASNNLVERTIGVVFLGKPFEGSSKAKWGSRALKILDLITTTHKEDVKDVEERSTKLISVNTAFQKFLKARDRSEFKQFVEEACFFEGCAMHKGKTKIGVIVPRELACLPGIDPQPIEANHVSMCKFEDEDKEGYKRISQKLSQWISNLDSRFQGSEENSRVWPSFHIPKIS